MYSKKKLINRKNKRLSKKKRTIGKKPLFRLYAKKKFVKYY